MSESLLIALFSSMAVAICGLWTWCARLSSGIDQLRIEVAAVKGEIGDHDSGLRGSIHTHSQKLTEHSMLIQILRK